MSNKILKLRNNRISRLFKKATLTQSDVKGAVSFKLEDLKDDGKEEFKIKYYVTELVYDRGGIEFEYEALGPFIFNVTKAENVEDYSFSYDSTTDNRIHGAIYQDDILTFNVEDQLSDVSIQELLSEEFITIIKLGLASADTTGNFTRYIEQLAEFTGPNLPETGSAGKPSVKTVRIPCVGASAATKSKYPDVYKILEAEFGPDGPFNASEEIDGNTVFLFDIDDSERNKIEDLNKVIRIWQEGVGFSGNLVDGILGPKSFKKLVEDGYGEAGELVFQIAKYFAKKQGIDPELVDLKYKFLPCPQGRGRPSTKRKKDKKESSCTERFIEMYNNDELFKARVTRFIKSTPKLEALVVDQRSIRKGLHIYLKENHGMYDNVGPDITEEEALCWLLDNNNNLVTQPISESLPSGTDMTIRREHTSPSASLKGRGCSGLAWTAEDVKEFLLPILQYPERFKSGLKLGGKGMWIAQKLKGKALGNKVRDFFARYRKDLENNRENPTFALFGLRNVDMWFADERAKRDIYSRYIDSLSQSIAKFLNLIVGDLKLGYRTNEQRMELTRMLGKEDYEVSDIKGGYDDNQGSSHKRYCKTGLVAVDRSRVVLAFFDFVEKVAITGGFSEELIRQADNDVKVRLKGVVGAWENRYRQYSSPEEINRDPAMNIESFKSDFPDADPSSSRRLTDVTRQTGQVNDHLGSISSNNFYNLVKLANHLDLIGEKLLSDKVELIIKEEIQK